MEDWLFCLQASKTQATRIAGAASRIRTGSALRKRRPRCAGPPDFASGEAAVADRIDAIVDRTIEHTRELLDANEIDWAIARIALERISDGLAADAPDHPALDRLRDFIAEQERLRRRR